jgi:hypothetical protein
MTYQARRVDLSNVPLAERSARAAKWHTTGPYLAVAAVLAACGGESSKGSAGHAGNAGTSAGASAGMSAAGGKAGMSAGGGAGTSAGGSAGETGGGGTGGVPAACSQCGAERECCDGHCANLANDPVNCGQCGHACDGGQYCTGGECIAKPCEATCADAGSCCGTECCATGQLCCDPQGPIETGARCTDPSETGTCPLGCAPLCKCTSPDTPIATPTGERAMGSLRVGDLVYSVDVGAIRAVPIVRVNRIGVFDHEVVRVKLANGVALEISGTHPTADGRNFYALRAGDELDHVAIVSAERIPYSYPFTYDILPSSSTGTYFAGGALIGSTLAAPSGQADF